MPIPNRCASSGLGNRRRPAVDENGSRIGPDRSGDDLRERALAGPVLSHQRVHFTGAQGEARVPQSRDAAVVFADVLRLEKIGHPVRISDSHVYAEALPQTDSSSTPVRPISDFESPEVGLRKSLMFAIIGIVVVFGAIVGGYLMEHGNLMVLMQPAELVIIVGAAVGTVLIANPLSVVIQMAERIGGGVCGAADFTKAFYLENLKMLNEIFSLRQKERNGQAGSGRRRAVEEPAVFQVQEFHERPSRGVLRLRHAAHVDQRRRGPFRARPDDGAGHGGAPSRSPRRRSAR